MLGSNLPAMGRAAAAAAVGGVRNWPKWHQKGILKNFGVSRAPPPPWERKGGRLGGTPRFRNSGGRNLKPVGPIWRVEARAVIRQLTG